MALEPLQLADFTLGEPLGSGSTSHVFAAVHRPSGREVAVKMLESSHRDSLELRFRLQREAVVLAGVESPHVGRILGFGYEDEHPFLVLERLRGETLADLLKRQGRVSLTELAVWVEHLLIGARDCHAAGVIHRDIKPANVFLQDQAPGLASAKLIDFGVARLKEIVHDGRSLTSTHHLLGSMGYMAPEQFQNAKHAGPQTDVYAIGVVIFRCVSGRLPFVSKSFEALIKMKLEQPCPVLSSMAGVARNERLDAFVQTALAPHPSSRFDDGKQMLEAWWRVAADLVTDVGFLDEVDVVFEDDIEVTTNTAAGGILGLSDTAVDRTNVTADRPDGADGGDRGEGGGR